MSRTAFVYILANKPRGVLYVGATGHLIRRIEQHKHRVVPSFTDTYGVLSLVHFEEYPSILEARAREHALKRWRRSWKFGLIEANNPDWLDLTNQIAL